MAYSASVMVFHHSPNHSIAKIYLFKSNERAPVSQNALGITEVELFPEATNSMMHREDAH